MCPQRPESELQSNDKCHSVGVHWSHTANVRSYRVLIHALRMHRCLSGVAAYISLLPHGRALDVSYNGFGGTLPTAVAAIRGGNFVGNCFPGYPPLQGCDGYYIGAQGANCTFACASLGMTCSPYIQTGNSPYLLQSLMATTSTPCLSLVDVGSGNGYVSRDRHS